MANINRIWKSPRPDIERLRLALAGYNQGAGNTLKAQKLCNMALIWADMVPCVALVTGVHAAETIQYVIRIERWYKELSDGRD